MLVKSLQLVEDRRLVPCDNCQVRKGGKSSCRCSVRKERGFEAVDRQAYMDSQTTLAAGM